MGGSYDKVLLANTVKDNFVDKSSFMVVYKDSFILSFCTSSKWSRSVKSGNIILSIA